MAHCCPVSLGHETGTWQEVASPAVSSSMSCTVLRLDTLSSYWMDGKESFAWVPRVFWGASVRCNQRYPHCSSRSIVFMIQNLDTNLPSCLPPVLSLTLYSLNDHPRSPSPLSHLPLTQSPDIARIALSSSIATEWLPPEQQNPPSPIEPAKSHPSFYPMCGAHNAPSAYRHRPHPGMKRPERSTSNVTPSRLCAREVGHAVVVAPCDLQNDPPAWERRDAYAWRSPHRYARRKSQGVRPVPLPLHPSHLLNSSEDL